MIKFTDIPPSTQCRKVSSTSSMHSNNPTFQNYLLRIGDSCLILGHRLSEWCGHAPILEEDIALTNLALDLLGVTRNVYQQYCLNEGGHRTEDQLAYLRDAKDFRNNLLSEQANGDFGQTILRQFLFSALSKPLFHRLMSAKNAELAGIAAKAAKEADYHLRHVSNWVVRLGDGTEESHGRMVKAVDTLWMYTDDLFETNAEEKALEADGFIVAFDSLREEWKQTVDLVFSEAGLSVPSAGYQLKGSLKGNHTEQIGFILAEMQFLQRAYPNQTW